MPQGNTLIGSLSRIFLFRLLNSSFMSVLSREERGLPPTLVGAGSLLVMSLPLLLEFEVTENGTTQKVQRLLTLKQLNFTRRMSHKHDEQLFNGFFLFNFPRVHDQDTRRTGSKRLLHQMRSVWCYFCKNLSLITLNKLCTIKSL